MGLQWQVEASGTRVLVACKSRLLAEALMFTLDSDPELEAVGYGLDGWEALELVAAFDPDVVVVAPDLGGLEPAAFSGLVETAFPHVNLVQLVEMEQEGGAAGDRLTTSCSADELLHAIGEARRSSSASLEGLPSLTRRTGLRLVAAGAHGG